MATTPVTGKIYLCKGVPLSNSYAHSIHFDTLAEQLTYFTGKANGELSASDTLPSGKVVKVLTHQNYVKKDSGVIRVEVQEESQEDVNYLIWKTPVIGNTPPGVNYKWFFAFITEIVYVSNAVTELHYELDVLQTFAVQSNWNGAVSFKECFIERRHTTSDSVGENIEPEPIVCDDYFDYLNTDEIGSQLSFWSGNYSPVGDVGGWCVLCFMAYDLSEGENIPSAGWIAGSYLGVRCAVFDNANDFSVWLNAHHTDYDAITSRIVEAIMVPPEFIHSTHQNLDNQSTKQETIHLGKPSDMPNYNVKNKKLLTYPYNFLYISDGDKTQGEFAFEDFTHSNNCDFELTISYQPNFEIMIAPLGYRGFVQARANYDYALTMGDFPKMPWNSDPYKTYMGMRDTQTVIGSLGGMFGGVVGGTVKGALSKHPENNVRNAVISGGAGFMGSLIGTQVQQMMRETKGFPIVHHGTNTNPVAVAGNKTFIPYQRCLRPKMAKKVDDYFTAFGYACNRIDTPNTTNGRKNQHYIKTVGCICNGGCNAEYLRQIEQIFNSGITWWNKNHVGEYN